MSMHPTIKRFVASLMLLAFAALFGASDFSTPSYSDTPLVTSDDGAVFKIIVFAAPTKHSDCDGATSGANNNARCSVDCSYVLADSGPAFPPCTQNYDLLLTNAMVAGDQPHLLRPPIV